jgi:hypothetical protein
MFGTHRKFLDKFVLYHKMSRTSFDDVLNLICDESVKTVTDLGRSTGPVDRLALTLRQAQTFLILLSLVLLCTYFRLCILITHCNNSYLKIKKSITDKNPGYWNYLLSETFVITLNCEEAGAGDVQLQMRRRA